MKKIKEEKGITLVALIITIVVLLILAAVAIGTVRDSDIIGHAQNAAGGYNQAKGNEVTTLNNYELKIEEYLPKNNESQGELKLNTKYYIIGKEGDSYAIFYANGSVEYEGATIEYSYNNGVVEFYGVKFDISNEGKNSVLISGEVEGQGRLLLATNTEGLTYFSGERYENQEGAYTSAIVLGENSVVTEYYGTVATLNSTPVLYKGILCFAGTAWIDDNGNEAFITTNDNCETLIVNGKVYTKVTE